MHSAALCKHCMDLHFQCASFVSLNLYFLVLIFGRFKACALNLRQAECVMIHGHTCTRIFCVCLCVYERWLVITKGFFISLSLGTRQQRHKLPPADYPLISTNAFSFSLSLILINVPAFMIPSLVCHLIKQSVLNLAAFAPISSCFPCLHFKYLHRSFSFSQLWGWCWQLTTKTCQLRGVSVFFPMVGFFPPTHYLHLRLKGWCWCIGFHLLLLKVERFHLI